MSDFDDSLIELEELLKDVPDNDPETHAALDVPGALEDLAEELEDQGLWNEREAMVQADVMRFVDNPSYPNALERMNMLNNLGGSTRWYDKWVAQRAEDAADGGDYEEMITQTNVEMQDLSIKAVDQAFEKVAQFPPAEAGCNSTTFLILDATTTIPPTKAHHLSLAVSRLKGRGASLSGYRRADSEKPNAYY